MNEIKFYSTVCVLAGFLRIISSFIDYESAPESIQVLYMIIDLGFILGLIGFHSLYRQELSWLGHVGFIVSICGFAVIAGPETDLFGIGIYQIGSPIVGVGILLLSSELIRKRLGGLLAPVLLIASVVLGLASMVLVYSPMFIATGILFGLGFMLLGVKLWSRG